MNYEFVICNQHLMKMLAVRNFFSTSHLYVFLADFLSVYFHLYSLLFLSLLGTEINVFKTCLVLSCL